jgi:acyl-CoA dehydrogenase
MGRSHIAPEACNCAAPDTGNMEVLHAVRHRGAEGAVAEPLLEGEIRSRVRDDRARRRQLGRDEHRAAIERDGDDYVSTAASGGSSARCATRAARSSS